MVDRKGKNFLNLGLQFTGKCTSNTLPDFRHIAYTSLIDHTSLTFFSILSFCDKCTRNYITKAAYYGAGYQRNENYLCIVNKHGQNSYERLVPDPQGWP